MEEQVLIHAGGAELNKLLRWYNPLDLPEEVIKKEWLTPKNVLEPFPFTHPDDPDWGEETDSRKKWWYYNQSMWEPGKNPYWHIGGRQGEAFGDYLFALSQIVQCPVPYDRTGESNYMNQLYSPIPEVPDGWNMSFEDIIHNQCQRIWDMNRPVRLWWSGGIDSTTILIGFLQTKKPEDNLIVYMSKISEWENPNFYERLKKMDDVTIQWNTKENIWDFSNWNDGTINVTGEPGDPFYGTFVVEHHIDDLNTPWQDMFKWEDINFVFREDDYRCNYHRPKFMEFAEYYASKCPIPCVNAFDFTWWLAFAIKWQWISHRIFPHLPNPSAWYNMISFYDDADIQRWSIVNHDLKHKGTWQTYKWPSKEYIYNFTKDAEYRDNKTKYKSLPESTPNGSMNTKFTTQQMIMTSGEYFLKTKERESYVSETVDPNILLLDKWEVFHKPTWDKWKRIINNG